MERSDREAVVAPVEGERRARMSIMAGRARKRKNRSFKDGEEEDETGDGLEADLCGDDEEDIQRAQSDERASLIVSYIKDVSLCVFC